MTTIHVYKYIINLYSFITYNVSRMNICDYYTVINDVKYHDADVINDVNDPHSWLWAKINYVWQPIFEK